MENRTTLRWGAQEVGRLTAAPEGADTCFRAEYRLTEGLWRLYAVGRQNRLLLGCAEGGQGILQRRFSRQLTEGLGALLGGAAEPVSAPEDWRPVWAGEFPGLALPEGALCRRVGRRRYLALPFREDGPFPLMLHPQANAMFHGCFPFLNQEGHRFMNEGTWVQGKSMNIMHQTGNIAWSIFDADYGKYNRMSLEKGTGGGMFWDTMSASVGQKFTDDDVTSTVESDIAVGNTFKANTIEELADMIGVPADEMKASIDRYNELVTKGADDDFHKPSDFLYPVMKAPFYAAKVGIALLAVVGGLSVNTDLQVLNDKKQPIAGLYATGNTSGDLYAIDYPINMAGNSNGRCVIWGYMLGKTLAGVQATGETLTSRDELAELSQEESQIVVSDTVYKDGTYTGTGKGRGGDMEVTVTIADGKVSDIVVNSHAESSDIGAPALDRLIQKAITANSAEIDGASGATMTSDGFRQAVAQALSKAQ